VELTRKTAYFSLYSSVDWGHYFTVPVLSPFELFVALGEVADSTLWSGATSAVEEEEQHITSKQGGDIEGGYPMDFYSKAGGPWTNYFEENKDRKVLAYGT
jgi:2-(3-amino-3-carboxypropyl)histidine synthase